jgi:hypothetical protein
VSKVETEYHCAGNLPPTHAAYGLSDQPRFGASPRGSPQILWITVLKTGRQASEVRLSPEPFYWLIKNWANLTKSLKAMTVDFNNFVSLW